MQDKLIEAMHAVYGREHDHQKGLGADRDLAEKCGLRAALAAVRAHDAGTDEAKQLSDMLCPPHAGIDKSGKLEPFDNCIACIRNERGELKSLLMRISTDCAQTALEDPLRAKDNWVLLSTPVREEIGWRSGEYARQSPASHAADSAPHDYLSTACFHGLHERCRQQCKFCDVKCNCLCHTHFESAPNSASCLGNRFVHVHQ